jgi:hypothetical protein
LLVFAFPGCHICIIITKYKLCTTVCIRP